MIEKTKAGRESRPGPAKKSIANQDYTPNLEIAQRFLSILDSEAESFTFQTFPEFKGAGNLAQILHGSLHQRAEQLARENLAGGGVFVTVNRTDSKGRKAENITGIRAVFADLDGQPITPVYECRLEPHLIIESSPGRFHAYWVVDGLALADFGGVQRAIAQRFGSDPAVCDLPRVMRLPGFWHRKAEPFQSKIIRESGALPYSTEQILAEFPPIRANGTGRLQKHAEIESNDPILAALSARGWIIGKRADSGFNIRCPFDADHTAPRAESSTVYYPAHTGGFKTPKIKCMHAHCTGRSMAEYEAALGLQQAVPGSIRADDNDVWANIAQQKQFGPVFDMAGNLDLSGEACGIAADAEPVQLPKIPDVPDFATELLPDALQAFVHDAAERARFRPDFAAVAGMVALGSLVGRKLGIRLKRRDDWTEYGNLWGVLVGPPSALKSPAMREALRPFKALQVESDAKYAEVMKSFEGARDTVRLRKDAAKKAAAKKLAKDPNAALDLLGFDDPEQPVSRTYWTSNATAEKLGVLLAENPNGLLVERDELSSFLSSLDDEANATARGLYLSGWSGKESYRFDRIIRGTTCLPKFALSIIGGIQPGPLQRYVRQAYTGDRADGLLQRFQLAVWPDPEPFEYVDRSPNGPAKKAAADLFRMVDEFDGDSIGRRDQFGDDPPFVHLSDAAQDVFVGWYADFMRASRGDDSNGTALDVHFGKYPGLVGKLALVTHIADDPTSPEISEKTILRALAWIQYLTPHAKRIYHAAENPETGAASLLLARLKRGEFPNGFTARDVYRKCWHGLTDKAAVRRACALLHDYRWLARADSHSAGPGRPSDPVFRLTEKARGLL